MWDAIVLWIAKDLAPRVELLVIGGALVLYCFVNALIRTFADKLRGVQKEE